VITLDFIELVKMRKSVRKYKPDRIPEEKVKHVIEAARLAPSWKNSQPWRFIVVTKEELKKRITTRDWAAEAPVIIVGVADPTLSGTRENKQYYLVDLGIAMEHMMLAATELGLGTCWIGLRFNEQKVKETLQIPDQYQVVAITPLGYPDEQPSPKIRKNIEEIVCQETWQLG